MFGTNFRVGAFTFQPLCHSTIYSCKLRNRTHLPITRRNTEKKRTLSHKARFSLHQSATWSEIKTASAQKNTMFPRKIVQYPVPYNHYIHMWNQKHVLCLPHDFCRCELKTDFVLTAFWETQYSCAHFPTHTSCNSPGKQSGHKCRLSS